MIQSVEAIASAKILMLYYASLTGTIIRVKFHNER